MIDKVYDARTFTHVPQAIARYEAEVPYPTNSSSHMPCSIHSEAVEQSYPSHSSRRMLPSVQSLEEDSTESLRPRNSSVTKDISEPHLSAEDSKMQKIS